MSASAEQPDIWLEYVQAESSHNQYIDTGVVAKRGTKVEYVGTYSGGNTRANLVGVNGDCELIANNGGYIGNSNVKSSIAFPVNSPDTEIVFTIVAETCPAGVSTDQAYRISVSDGVQTDEVVGRGWSSGSSYTMYLFGGNNKDGTINRNNLSYGKCRSLKIWRVPDGGSEYVLVRDYRPCMMGGVAGMYDAVANKTYLSSYGAFASGPEKPKPGLMVFVR